MCHTLDDGIETRVFNALIVVRPNRLRIRSPRARVSSLAPVSPGFLMQRSWVQYALQCTLVFSSGIRTSTVQYKVSSYGKLESEQDTGISVAPDRVCNYPVAPSPCQSATIDDDLKDGFDVLSHKLLPERLLAEDIANLVKAAEWSQDKVLFCTLRFRDEIFVCPM